MHFDPFCMDSWGNRGVYHLFQRENLNLSKQYLMNSASFLITVLILFVLTGCGPTEEQKKETLAKRIAHETCDDISSITTGVVGSLIDALFNQITEGNISDINTRSLGKVPEYWCDCYTYFVVKDLTEKFTFKEIQSIKKDKTKQILVLEKILEFHQADLKQCISESTNKIFKDYSAFEKELDKKYNQSN